MLSIALTGNIGAGKTTVAEFFRRWGATIIDADQLARETQRPGQPVLQEIANRFGADVLAPDGSLDRTALRARVLADPRALTELNRIVHPEVRRRRLELLAQARARGDRIVVSDIPLLFEADDPRSFDAVVLVDAPEEVRRARLLASRSLSVEDADRMMASQLSAATKRSRCDYVIDNDGDLATLERAAADVWRALIARA
ncbi:MAG TPA: dephospho-CoA kinase [Gemmatimonadales bacterium]|nr:dephospho-CoA kinase [Gemmatimonadales bacterium]